MRCPAACSRTGGLQRQKAGESTAVCTHRHIRFACRRLSIRAGVQNRRYPLPLPDSIFSNGLCLTSKLESQ